MVKYPCSIAEYSEILLISGPYFCTVRCILYNLPQGFFFRGTQRQWGDKCIENTFYTAIQSTFKSLEMHSKRRYKICIRVFGYPRATWVGFQNYKGLQYYFPEIVDEIKRIMNTRIFLVPLSIVFFILQNFKVSFFLRKIT